MRPVSQPSEAMHRLKQICGQTEKFEKKIVGKEYLLGKYFEANKKKRINKKDKKFTKSKIEKLLKIQEDLVQKERTYQFYLPLHNLWQSYTSDLLKNDNNDDSVCLKLLRADYHGAYLKVIHSTVDSYIGLEGIIINESLKTFKIINKDNRVLMLLKNEIIFQVQILDKFFAINGNNLIFRSTDRAKHKFKIRQADKINLDFIGLIMQPQSDE